VVAIRTFWNQAEAALEKSHLDDYEIFCALIHENAHLWCGAPLAMPIRLLVDERDADWVFAVLAGDLEAAARIESSAQAAGIDHAISAAPEPGRDNLWELLMIAFYLLVPGLTVLQTKYPTIALTDQRASRAIAAVALIHFFGWLGIATAIAFVTAYAHLKRSAVRQQNDAI
jgi:hypothetical protein